MLSQTKHTGRVYVIMGIVALISIVFLGRLFVIQVLDDSYKLSAENNVLRYVTEYPARGLMYDRNGELLVFNEAAYDPYGNSKTSCGCRHCIALQNSWHDQRAIRSASFKSSEVFVP